MGEKLTAAEKRIENKGFVRGIAIACSIIQGGFDEPTLIEEVLRATNLDRMKMKRAGVDDYDLDILRPVFIQMRQSDKWQRERAARRALDAAGE